MDEVGAGGAPDKPAGPPAPAPLRTKNALLALLLLALPIALGVSWLSARSRGKLLSKQLYEASVELSECVQAASGDAATLREAVELSPASSTPLGGCASLAARAHATLGDLGALRWARDREGVRELDTIVRVLGEARFGERADVLAAGELESLESGVAGLLKGACRVAIGEGSLELGACPPSERAIPARALPVPRLVLDAPAEFLLKTAFSVDPGSEGELRLAFATRERDSASIGLRLGSSKDGGKSFEFVAGSAGRADGLPALPAVGFAQGAPQLVLSTQRDEKGAYKTSFIVRLADGGQRFEDAIEVPALPEGLEPLAAGTPVWLSEGPKKQLVPTLAIGPRDPSRVGGALVRLTTPGQLELLPAPTGTLIAAATEPRPRLVSFEAAGPSSSLVLYDVPKAGAAWTPVDRVELPAGRLVAEPATESRCGVAGEKLFPFAARFADRSLFAAIGAARLFTYRFDAPPASELTRVCGSCPPALLARAEDALTLVSPIGNRMVPMDAGAPVVVTAARAGRHSVASCEGEVVLVVHVVHGSVYAQVARFGHWQFGRPTLLGAPNSDGAPVDVRATTAQGKLFVFWRRDQRMRLRVEMLASDDGGVSWR